MKKAFLILSIVLLACSCNWSIDTDVLEEEAVSSVTTKSAEFSVVGTLWDCGAGVNLRIGTFSESVMYARNLYFDTDSTGLFFLTEKIKTEMRGGWNGVAVETISQDTTFVLASDFYEFSYSIQGDEINFEDFTVPYSFPKGNPSYTESTIDYALFGNYCDIHGSYPERPALLVCTKLGGEFLGNYFEPSKFDINNLINNDKTGNN